MEDAPKELSAYVAAEHDPLAWAPSSAKPGFEVVAVAEAITAEGDPQPTTPPGSARWSRFGNVVLRAGRNIGESMASSGLIEVGAPWLVEAPPVFEEPSDDGLKRRLHSRYERRRIALAELYRSAVDSTKSNHRVRVEGKQMYLTSDPFMDPPDTYFAIYEAADSLPHQPVFDIDEYAGLWDVEHTSCFPHEPLVSYKLRRYGDDFIMTSTNAAGNRRIGDPERFEEMMEIIDDALDLSKDNPD